MTMADSLLGQPTLFSGGLTGAADSLLSANPATARPFVVPLDAGQRCMIGYAGVFFTVLPTVAQPTPYRGRAIALDPAVAWHWLLSLHERMLPFCRREEM